MLVLQTTITFKPYDYTFALYFTQNAAMNCEVRTTGIFSTAPINLEDSVPYRTVVTRGQSTDMRTSPMVEESRRMLPDSPHAAERNVPNCDHSLRLPGGMSSTEDFWKFLPLDDPAIRNFFGVCGRVFKIVNERVANPMTNKTQPS
ncbi:hypothetical protein N7522_013134 [Penicillium canescens]|nr:hypothetical protein N7522_013134 [Penicillium canescens]